MARERDFQSFSAFDFSEGLDVRRSPQQLASKYRKRLFKSQNMEQRKTGGGVSKRLDTAAYNTNTIGASVAITGGFQYRMDNGTNIILGGTDDGRVVKFNSDGTTTDLTTGKTAGTRWYFDKFDNYAIISNRADAPMKYDGTTFGSLSGSPPSTGGPHVVHGNRVFFLDATNPRRLTWSKLNDGEDYTAASNAGSVVVTGPIASPLVGLQTMTSELVLGHREHITRLQGTSPSTYAITNALPAKVSTGLISPQGIMFANNDVRWVSGRGIHGLATSQNFGDLEEAFLSERIDPYFSPNTEYTVSLNQLEKAVCCYDSQNNRELYGVDTDGDGENDTIFVRDLYGGAWSVWPNLSCASLFPVYNGTNGTEIFMGGYDGFLRRLNVSAATNAIDGVVEYVTDLGAPHWQKSLRHTYWYFQEEGNYSVSITDSYDFGASGGTTRSVSLLGDTDTLGSTFVLGTSTLGARSQLVKRVNMSGLGEFVKFIIRNSQAGQPFTLLGFQALYRNRRLIGRASVD
jgi:hypothetical protein